MADSANLKATARVTITKYDEHGVKIGAEEHLVELTNEEAKELWRSQQQA